MLVVGDWPTKAEAEKTGPFTGVVAKRLALELVKLGPEMVFDHAIRCPIGGKKAEAAWVEACRGYLARTLQFRTYKHVFAFGRTAARSIAGRSIDALSAKGAFTWLEGYDIPVSFFPSIREITLNRGFYDDVVEGTRRALERTLPRPPKGAIVTRVTRELLPRVSAWLRSYPTVTVDVETSGRVYDDDFRLLSVALSHAGDLGQSWIWLDDDLTPGTPLARYLESVLRKKPIDAHNAKYEGQAIPQWFGWDRLETLPIALCTMLGSKLLDGAARVGLEVQQDRVGFGGGKAEMKAAVAAAKKVFVAEERERVRAEPDPEAAEKRSPKLNNPDAYVYAFVPKTTLARYNAADSVSQAALGSLIREDFEASERNRILRDTWEYHLKPLNRVVTLMERHGVRVERTHARRLQAQFAKRIAEIDTRLAKLAPINWGSSPQVADFLYGKCGLPVPWKTEGGAPSTDKHALKKLKASFAGTPGGDAAAELLERRQLKTLDGTYAWGFERYIQDDGRVHTNFKIHGTETGRFSSEAPNAQNLPKSKTPDGKLVKDLMLASPGRVLVAFDQSTVEIRVAAALSGDAAMLRLLESGVDFHLATARLIAPIFGVNPLEVDKDHWLRDVAKTLNFALLYGKGDKSAAEDLDVSEEIAAQVRDGILGTFTDLAHYIESQQALVVRERGVWVHRWAPGARGSSEAIPSRWRPLADATSYRNWIAAKAGRVSTNTPVQGGAAELTNAALYLIQDRLEREGLAAYAALNIQVHDQIGLDVDKNVLSDILQLVPEVMTSFAINVPLAVDAGVGPSFGSMEKV